MCDPRLQTSQLECSSSDLFNCLQNIAIGVAAVLGGLVLYKVIKNDDSVSFTHSCLFCDLS